MAPRGGPISERRSGVVGGETMCLTNGAPQRLAGGMVTSTRRKLNVYDLVVAGGDHGSISNWRLLASLPALYVCMRRMLQFALRFSLICRRFDAPAQRPNFFLVCHHRGTARNWRHAFLLSCFHQETRNIQLIHRHFARSCLARAPHVHNFFFEGSARATHEHRKYIFQ